jgi:fatty-acyl-CoA synthase
LFSGYWAADEINREQFQDGWFCMGDLFTRDATGGIQFVGRAKYLIKSGGENIYPAEIERILLADARVEDAIVIRQPDPKWGEVPVALVARRDDSLTADDLATQCRAELAGYKQPKQILFVEMSDFARSETGKIIREDMERWVETHSRSRQ